MEKVKNFFERKIAIYGVIAAILIIGGIFVFRKNQPIEETLVVHNSDFVNQTSVSGKVIPASNVSLAFKTSGRINKVYSKVGDNVKTGQILAMLDSNDALGSLQIAKANYDKLLNGATNTDIDVAKSAVERAQVALDQTKIQQDLLVKNAKKNLLNSGFVVTTDDVSTQTPPTVSGSYLKEAEGKITITQYSSSGGTAFNTKGLVETSGMVNTEIPQPIGDTGLYIKFASTLNDSTTWTIDIPNKQSALYLQNLNAYLAAEATAVQMIANANAELNQAKSALLLKQSGARSEDIRGAEGSLQMAQSVYESNFIKAPFDGVVTKIDAKAGEIASMNTPMISMISLGTFQIESFVPEVNIAQIKLGNEASVTLDAYGNDISFMAKVVEIDPAETVRDGVSTYKIKLQFNEMDEKIKSGMTANVLITTNKKSNTIVIPQGVIVEKNNKKFVQVKKDNTSEDREVTIGGKSSLGQVEILSGLADGDVVLLNPKIN